MSTRTQNDPVFGICVQNADYPASLELRKLYQVIPDDDAKGDGLLRVVDESGEDYLYPAEYFLVVDLPHDVRETLTQLISHTAA